MSVHVRRLLFMMALTGVSALPALAQFTVTASDVLAQFGKSSTVTYYSVDFPSESNVNALIGLKGANKSWDFTTLTFNQGETTTTEFVSPTAGLPGSASYAGADFAIVSTVPPDSTFNSYYDILANGVYSLGSVATEGSSEFSLTYNPPLIAFPLPMGFGSTWNGQSTFTSTVDGESIEITLSHVGEVDGWGTVTLPNGTFNCLRYKLDVHQTMFGFDTPHVQYVWMLSSMQEAASVMVSTMTIPFVGTITTYSIGYAVISGQGGVDVERVGAEIPTRVALHANYPNPFNPTTTMRFDLHESGPVRMSVYSALGIEVAVPVNETLSAGTHEVSFAAGSLPSGMYLVRLTAGNENVTRTITLLR